MKNKLFNRKRSGKALVLISFLTILTGIQLLSGCKEIVAENITGFTPVLIIPQSNDTVNINPVQFKWEAMKGASKYHLQVVSPSFSAINSFVLDTLISGTEFYFALDSNEYELKLTAVNGGYQSQTLGPVKFWVGVQPEVSSNLVVLTSPANSQFVNGTFTGAFSWNSLTNASSYEFSIRLGDFATGTVIDTQNGISTTSVNLSSGITLSEGVYEWGVKAYLTGGTETVYSKRQLQVDTTNPNVPSGTFSPSGGTSVSPGNITFSWNNGTDPGVVKSPVYSTIEVSDDINFTSVLFTETLIGNSTGFDIFTQGAYYWRVINVDGAGNSSVYSQTNEFTVF